MLIRNSDANCGNCPFWAQLKAQPTHGECRGRIPLPLLIPKTQAPTVASPNTPMVQKLMVDYQIFTPPSDFWCSTHPMILAEIVDGPGAN